MVQPDLLRQTHKLTTKLPLTPLSYDGRIVRIVWYVRVRIFFDDGGERTFEKAIRVGNAEFLPPDAGRPADEAGGEADSLNEPPDDGEDVAGTGNQERDSGEES